MKSLRRSWVAALGGLLYFVGGDLGVLCFCISLSSLDWGGLCVGGCFWLVVCFCYMCLYCCSLGHQYRPYWGMYCSGVPQVGQGILLA